MPDSLEVIRKDILDFCFDHYDGTFAGGQEANNKLDLERIERLPHLAAQVVSRQAELIAPYSPDLLVSTPRGADWLVRRVARRLGITALFLDKNEETKEFSYYDDGEQTVERSERVAIGDDALNLLTNTGKVYRLPGIAERTVGVFGIWDRNPRRENSLPVPIESVISEEIPDILPPGHPLWKYAR